MEWMPIETAPRDGTRVLGRDSYVAKAGEFGKVPGKLYYRKRITRWGKVSHVPLYGWTYGRVEDVDLWQPIQWKPLPEPPKGA